MTTREQHIEELKRLIATHDFRPRDFLLTTPRARGHARERLRRRIAQLMFRLGVVAHDLVETQHPVAAGAGSGMNASAPEKETNIMIDVSKFASSAYLKVAHLKEHDGPIKATIVAVAVNTKFKKLHIDLSDGTVLSCNPSNVTRLIRAWGAESETWVGREIESSIGEVDYQGQPTETIVATPVGPPLENKAPVKKPPKRGNAGGDLDDEIPSEGDESLSGRKALSSPSL
jgi:hypothetical protein